MPRQTRESTHRVLEVPTTSPKATGDLTVSTSPASVETPVKGSRPKEFQCERCPRTFTRRENLARHANSHDHTKYHQCGICGKSFSRSDMLSRHEAGHERWDQQNPSVSHPGGPRKRRKVAFEDDASSTNTADPIPEIREQNMVAQQTWNQNLHQSASPGVTTLSSASGNSGYEFNNSSGQHATIAHQSPNSLSQISDTLQPPYGGIDALGSSKHLAHHQTLPNLGGVHGDVPSPLTSFDFSAFLLPQSDGEASGFSYDWFSNDFYSAMKETGNEDIEFNDMLSLTFQSPMQFDQYSSTPAVAQSWEPQPNFARQDVPEDINHFDDARQLENLSQPEPGRISRISSPPNEPSEEDKWPFTWNPRSRPILRANPVKIPENHALWRAHNTRFDITKSTFRRVQAFINPVIIQGFARPHLDLPSLPEVNIFVNLFFERFSPQAPVLHHATVDTNDDLPPPLLAAMIVIGAIHSRLPGTRRFSIVLLDIVRWNLQTAIECDNTLMREPMIIFAEALICHAGIWCGNKRAFELAEIVRSMAVKHVRSAQFWRGNAKPVEHEQSENSMKADPKVHWKSWIAKEAQKRLFWVIYALDAQFAALMYLPATFAIGEVRNLCCPCDDEFWSARTARHWKSLLGDASVPPSRTFSAAMAPFAQSFAPVRSGNLASRPQAALSPVLNLNAWSAFLVLATLQVQIFNFSQERLFADSMIIQDEPDDAESQSPGEDCDEAISNDLQQWQTIRREILLDSLTLWEHAYLTAHSFQDRHPTSIYFRQASFVSHPTALILLDISISDLQNAIGKDGNTGIPEAMSKLHHWVKTSPRVAEQLTYACSKTIATPLSALVPRVLGPTACEQAIIAIFLCHVVVWIFSSVASPLQKESLAARLRENKELWNSPQIQALRQVLEFRDENTGREEATPAMMRKKDVLGNIFKSAAQSLTHLGTWGAALNLALLLHRRAEMQ
ncbi:Fungal specific transcription factor domain containing protein [Hyaloscypha variabilis]